jgi:hypothetical protein
MPEAPTPPEQSPQRPSEAPKRSYHPPQVRELGHLAEITGTGGGDLIDGGTDPPSTTYASA